MAVIPFRGENTGMLVPRYELISTARVDKNWWSTKNFDKVITKVAITSKRRNEPLGASIGHA